MRFENENTPKIKISKALLKRISSYFSAYWKHLLLVLLAIALTSLLGLVPPILIREIIDKALPGKNLHLLALLTGASLLATIFIGLIGVAENYLSTWVALHIIYDIKNAMYKHLEFMSLQFFSQVKPGDVITRMTSDINGIQDVLRNTVINFVRNILVFVVTAAALITMNWKLALLGLFVVPFFTLPTRRVGKVRWTIASQTQEKLQQLNQIIQETLSISGSTLIKIFTREETEYQKFKNLNQDVTELMIKEAVAGRWFRMTMSIFTTIGPMLIYFYGGYLFIQDEISVGAIVAFVTLLSRLYGPIVQLSNTHIDLTRSLALFERIFEYFDMKHDVEDAPNAIAMAQVKGEVAFCNVSFAYQPASPILKDISFHAAPNTMIALVGPSGAGKTTITNLIPRLYDAGEGTITLDGIDTRQISLTSLRAHIGMVMQESYLFNDSIRENLLYAKSDATEEELITACQKANIHDFIITLPDGYNTIVGNRGVKLSGGEKQRIAIARVILKDPSIIILDEATSSLDSLSEQLIQEAMEPLLTGKTSFIIAHRLSTVMAADIILVLENGRIVESGQHVALLQQGGLYKTLYDTQFRSHDH
ncbi:MAG: ABC transporter ATP-binding protein/permease [Firmicutes bacterium]|nr:ABC transporter ATP-binding protein/permease [Bacillota bacterium]